MSTTEQAPKIYLERILGNALFELGLAPSGVSAGVTEPARNFGDYSTNVALALGKGLKQKPADLALKIIAKIKELDTEKYFSEITEVRGFVNFYLSDQALAANVSSVLCEREKYGHSTLGGGKKILIDYFQPNIAKPLHLGHMRTAVIGDALFRILTALGYQVESDTHLGDWGTQFGLLLYAYKQWGDDEKIKKDPINELNKLYIKINAEIEKNPALREAGKTEFVKLEKGDGENRRLWQQFVDWSWQEFDALYEMLDFRRADHNWGESFFESRMQAVVDELKKKKLLVASEGAQIVDLSEWKLGVAVIIKSDGATTYLLRDLATFIFRKSEGFTSQLYVVDARQKHTLAQNFKILELLGYIKKPGEAVHVDFGFLSLPEGAMSTRKGNVIGPRELIDKAREMVAGIISEKNPELANKAEVAKTVARAAIKYYDLSHNRKSDIVFRWDEVLNFEGNSGPYLQYTYARIKSILRKAGEFAPGQDLNFSNPEERQIARFLVKYPEVVARSGGEYLPNYLTEYLYELCGYLNNFYQKVRVVDEPDANSRLSRLCLISAAAQVIKNGLDLIGIKVPEEM